jgi:GNAT superfamily N-acetyltransferase
LTLPVVTIERLARDRGSESALIEHLTGLENRAYAIAELGLWLKDVARTNFTEMQRWVEAGEMVLALQGTDVVGAVRSKHRDDASSWFGALAVDAASAGHGVARALVEHVEQEATKLGSKVMELEVLTTHSGHPHLDRLRAWYERLGYTETSRRNLQEVSPEEAPFMAVQIEAVVMRKQLPT